jgi:hypothetical protein
MTSPSSGLSLGDIMDHTLKVTTKRLQTVEWMKYLINKVSLASNQRKTGRKRRTATASKKIEQSQSRANGALFLNEDIKRVYIRLFN